MSQQNIPAIVFAAPHSGGGKTTITAGIIAALSQQGHIIQPFKVGPDYIDPSYHALAAGRPCRNLDSWMLGQDKIAESVARNSRTADYAIVEGVMGLFDGATGAGLEGSTAEIATLLNAPIVLIINARGMARSAAALVHGYATFEPTVKLAGIILNNVGSARHAEICATEITAKTPDVPVLGYVLRDERLILPERHLGLIPTAEKGAWAEVITFAAESVAQTVDLNALLQLAEKSREKREERKEKVSPPKKAPRSFSQQNASRASSDSHTPRIALADDAAFSFTYPENIELLEEAGAEIVRFSPLNGDDLPPNCQGIILVGGFPELYAEQLSQNKRFFSSLKQAHQQNIPIYGECGGLMVLTEGITDLDGRFWDMAGLIPGRCQMEKRVTLGYRIVTTAVDGPILKAGETVRGHEFHYSSWIDHDQVHQPAYTIQPRRTSEVQRPSGIAHGSIWASYIHLHFLTHTHIAPRFVAQCLKS